MIKQMVLRNLHDADGDEVTRCVDAEDIAFHEGRSVEEVREEDKRDFMIAAMVYLEDCEDMDVERAKLDVWY